MGCHLSPRGSQPTREVIHQDNQAPRDCPRRRWCRPDLSPGPPEGAGERRESPPRPRGQSSLPTWSSPSVRCSPRRRSPTAKSLTHKPPSRLTSRVWKRLHRRSWWSGPPQTAPPHGSTDAGDEADEEAVAAASGGGEATQRHNTLLTIGREARATGRRGEHERYAGVPRH